MKYQDYQKSGGKSRSNLIEKNYYHGQINSKQKRNYPDYQSSNKNHNQSETV